MNHDLPGLFSLCALSFGYRSDRPPLLNIPDWTAAAGQALAIIGENGSGKSTLLRLLALLLRPQAGAVLLAGADPWQQDRRTLLAARRRVTLVDQAPYLLRRSAAANVEYPLRCRAVPRTERRVRVEAALAAVGLEHLAGRLAPACSGGEQKRLALARGLALQPDGLLVDEPTAFLDEGSVRQVERLLAAWPGGGGTLLFTAHHPSQAFRVTHRVYELADGALRPLRAINHFYGRLEGEPGGESRFVTAGVALRVPAGQPQASGMHLPPHEILLSREPLRSSARNCLPGRITRLQGDPLGVTVWVDVGVELEVRLTSEAMVQFGFAPGQGVYATFKASSVRLY